MRRIGVTKRTPRAVYPFALTDRIHGVIIRGNNRPVTAFLHSGTGKEIAICNDDWKDLQPRLTAYGERVTGGGFSTK